MNERNLNDNPEKVHLIYFASHLQQKFSYCISSISLSDKLNYFLFQRENQMFEVHRETTDRVKGQSGDSNSFKRGLSEFLSSKCYNL